MKKHTTFFVGTVEVCLRGYIYNHSWVIPAESNGVAEILMEQHLEDKYLHIDEYAYSICSVFEIEEQYIQEIKKLLPSLPCKKH